jgi:hypothetical protein
MTRNIAVNGLLSCAIASAAAPAVAAHLRIAFDSYGPVRIGMTRQEIGAALGTGIRNENPDADTEGCEYVVPGSDHAGVSFMLLKGRLARIDVNSPDVLTLSGARIGATQDAVLALYRDRVRISPHAYSAPEGSYLTMHSADKRNGIRFETYQGKVTGYYAGTAEAIEYIEGCL